MEDQPKNATEAQHLKDKTKWKEDEEGALDLSRNISGGGSVAVLC